MHPTAPGAAAAILAPAATLLATAAPRAGALLTAALLATAPFTARAAQPAGPGAGRAHTVTIEDMRYNPQTLTVRRGDRITWINDDLVPHTVTATAGKFDSHLIQPGNSWTYLARKAGEYDYKCTLHVTMKGKVLVR